MKTVVRVERGAELDASLRDEPLLALLLPLGQSAVELDVAPLGVVRLDRASLALISGGTPYRLRAASSLAEHLTILPATSLLARVHREYRRDVDLERMRALFAVPRVLPRTRWVDEIAHRYLFEREVCKRPRSLAAAFLEIEIVKEMYFLCVEQETHRTRATVVHEGADVAERARTYLDEHLFEPLRVKDLARRAGTSESTLLRAFRREVGMAPAAYVRERRLEAALLLLRAERYTVGEIATKVGYTSLAAFTVAFRRRYGAPPSSMKQRDAFERLPPHGEPPRVRRKRRKL